MRKSKFADVLSLIEKSARLINNPDTLHISPDVYDDLATELGHYPVDRIGTECGVLRIEPVDGKNILKVTSKIPAKKRGIYG